MGFAWNVSRNFFKMLITLGAIVLGLYVIMAFRFWDNDWTDYFFRTGRWEEIIFVSLVGTAVSTIVMWLLKWHVRAQGRS